jgi:hypothetical protein
MTRFRSAKESETRQVRIVLDSERRGEPTAIDNEFRMGRLFGSPIPQDMVCTTDVIVNVFDGGPRTTVEYRIDGFEPVRMKPGRRPDPFVQEVFARNQATKKPWAKAELCSHIWTARLPANLEAGTHCIMVRVIDEYGREHHDHLCLEVIGTQAARAIIRG